MNISTEELKERISHLQERLKDMRQHKYPADCPNAAEYLESLKAEKQQDIDLLTELLAVREAQSVPAAGTCEQDVYEHGKSACMVDIPKHMAEEICRCLSLATGFRIDWHYFGGRVHIKVLAPPAPAVPAAIEPTLEAIKAILPTANPDEYACCVGADMWNACRAAMLKNTLESAVGTAPAVNIGNMQNTPAGFKLVPVDLTAENGAKASLIGEFTEVKYINCPECFGDDWCEGCDGSGRIKVEVPVTWTTIKAIWKKGIEHFDSLAAAPTPTRD